MLNTKQHGVWVTGDRREALITALPPLLMGLGIALAALIIGGPCPAVPLWRLAAGAGVGLATGAVLSGGGLVAIVRRLPDWGYTWLGTDLTGLLIALNVVSEDHAFLLPPAVQLVVLALLLLAGLAVLAAAVLRGWRPTGLLGIGLSATMGLLLCFLVTAGPFHRYDLALLAAPLGLLLAALVYVYARSPTPACVAVLAGVGLVNIALLWMAERVWPPWHLSRGEPHTWWPLLVFLVGPLLGGPLLGLLGQPLRRALGRA